jgi:hypothetical protein
MVDVNITSPPPANHLRARWSLRMLFGLIAIAAAVLAIVAVKLGQDDDRQRAFVALHQMGLRDTISSLPGHRTTISLRCEDPTFSDEQIPKLIAQLKTLTRRHDLGISAGLEPAALDLTHSRVTPAGEQQLREAFPQAQITR